MKSRVNPVKTVAEEWADGRLQQLLHLKSYETADAARMIKNKQNIMRQVREANSKTRWSLSSLLEMNMPWFFAEPRYGIALLFIIFAGLQFWAVSSQKQAPNTGIYTSENMTTVLNPNTTAYSTNTISYPSIPDNFQLFPEQQESRSVKFVGRRSMKK